MRNCANCQFGKYNRAPGASAPDLQCRRHAPRPNIGDVSVLVVWPAVTGEDVCGDWKPDAATVKARREKRVAKLRERRNKRLR